MDAVLFAPNSRPNKSSKIEIEKIFEIFKTKQNSDGSALKQDGGHE